jgi:phenylalanyl-tRNA synthetase beta subunit
MLVNVANLNRWYPSINLFEIGHIYSNKQESSKVALISGQKIDLPNSIMITPENYITKRKYYAWEGEIDQLLKLIPDVKAKYTIPIRPYHSISKYPPVVRDIAILINKDIPVNTIRDDLFEIEKDLLTIELFDEFESEKIGLDKKSLGLRLILDDPNKTMTTEEIDSKMANIYAFLNQKYQASIR